MASRPCRLTSGLALTLWVITALRLRVALKLARIRGTFIVKQWLKLKRRQRAVRALVAAHGGRASLAVFTLVLD